MLLYMQNIYEYIRWIYIWISMKNMYENIFWIYINIYEYVGIFLHIYALLGNIILHFFLYCTIYSINLTIRGPHFAVFRLERSAIDPVAGAGSLGRNVVTHLLAQHLGQSPTWKNLRKALLRFWRRGLVIQIGKRWLKA